MIFFDSDNLLVATNENHWSWEYDSIVIKANLIFNIKNGKLFLDLIKIHTKTGLGPGITKKHIGKYEMGTLKKPKKREILSILKEKKLDKPFPRDGWYINGYDDKPGVFQMSLSNSIDNFKNNKHISRMLKLNKIKKLLNN